MGLPTAPATIVAAVRNGAVLVVVTQVVLRPIPARAETAVALGRNVGARLQDEVVPVLPALGAVVVGPRRDGPTEEADLGAGLLPEAVPARVPGLRPAFPSHD